MNPKRCGNALVGIAALQDFWEEGPDGWRGSELEHLPEAALQTACDLFAQVEAGQDWPAQLGHWKQVHLQKPNKELGALASLRPISLSSVWYRIWSGIRVQLLSPWLAQVLPDEQHGSVHRKGVHTALSYPLALLELGKDPTRAGRDGSFRFIGAADLAKAYDSLGAEFCTRALGRMGVPASLLQACWRVRRVQGDAASPMALCAVISEALAEYAATGGLAAQTALQETLEQSGTVGTVVERPKVLGTRLQLTRAHTGPYHDAPTLDGASWAGKPFEPWVWEHTDAHSILDARLPAHRGNAAWLARGGRVVCSLPGQGKAHVAHVLRDAWRAQQWREFQDSGTKAAQAAGHLQWRDVEPRAVLVSKACEAAPPPLRPHMRAIAVGHWVSQARFQFTQGQAVDPCCYCGDASLAADNFFFFDEVLDGDYDSASSPAVAGISLPVAAYGGNNYTGAAKIASCDTSLAVRQVTAMSIAGVPAPFNSRSFIGHAGASSSWGAQEFLAFLNRGIQVSLDRGLWCILLVASLPLALPDNPILHLGCLAFLGMLGLWWGKLLTLWDRHAADRYRRARRRQKARVKRMRDRTSRGRSGRPAHQHMARYIFAARMCGQRRCRHARGCHILKSGFRRECRGLCLKRTEPVELTAPPCVSPEEAYNAWLAHAAPLLEGGKGGAARSKRKRREAQAMVAAVLDALSRSRKPKRGRGAPKPQTVPVDKGRDNHMTRQLMGHLKDRLNAGDSDAAVLSWLRQVMPAESPQDDWGQGAAAPMDHDYMSHHATRYGGEVEPGTWAQWDDTWWYTVDPHSGNAPSGNLVVVTSKDMLSQVQDLWHAFDDPVKREAIPVTSKVDQGRWQSQIRGKQSQIVGYLRLRDEVAEKLLPLSGEKGVFTCLAGENSAVNPFWIRSTPGESRESYYLRVMSLKRVRNQPVLYRSGGGHCLGFPRMPQDKDAQWAKQYTLTGVPKSWDSTDLNDFFKEQGWKQIEQISRRRSTWHFKAVAPVADQTSWMYVPEEGESWSIGVTMAAGTRPSAQVTPLRQPRKQREPPRQVSASVTAGSADRPDMDTDSPEAGESTTPQVGRTDRSRSPPARPPSPPIDPAEAQKQGWHMRDLGGCGDCFFRAAAEALAQYAQPDKPLREAEAIAQGALLRTETVAHIRKHASKFQALFSTREEFDHWLEKAPLQQTWAEGKLIQACAERTGAPVIIWAWSNERSSWERFTISGRFSDGMATCASNRKPMVLILRDKHYCVLKPPKEHSVPQGWLRETVGVVIDLSGASPSGVDLLGLGEATPSVHTLADDTPRAPPSVVSRDLTKPIDMSTQGNPPRQSQVSLEADRTHEAEGVPSRKRRLVVKQPPQNSAFTEAALQAHTAAAAAAMPPPAVPGGRQGVKLLKGKARKHELYLKRTIADWSPWPCPICHTEVLIKGQNDGQHYRAKHLMSAHGVKLKDMPMPGRQASTHRAQLRVTQLPHEHSLLHVKQNGLNECPGLNGCTWVCRKCLCRGTSGKVGGYQCQLYKETKRAHWWNALSRKHRQLLTSKVGWTDSQTKAFAKWARETAAKSKPRVRALSAKDIQYHKGLKRARAAWRRANNLAINPRRGGHQRIYNIGGWIRDLTTEGVEPNPGPPREVQSSRRPDRQEVATALRDWQFYHQASSYCGPSGEWIRIATERLHLVSAYRPAKFTQLRAGPDYRKPPGVEQEVWFTATTVRKRTIERAFQISQSWISDAIRSAEEDISKRRISAWKHKLRHEPQAVWKRLSRHRGSPPLTSLKCPRTGVPVTGEGVTKALQDFWEEVWPTRPTPQQHALLEQLAAEDTAWPNIPPPPVPPLSPADVRRAAARQRHKAPGPDGWRGSELEHLPEAALQTACDLFAQVEAGQDWPAQLGHWKQVHLQKPNKELGALASLRPISLSSVWYRIWSGIRVQLLSPWLAQVLPDEQHGSVRRKGVHTALSYPLALLELGKDPMRAGHDGSFRFIGAADLAKAYDSLGAEFCTRALGRMGVPASLLQAWDRAWRVQARWLCAAGSVSQVACSQVWWLPQGDAASPMALCAVISEALVRVKRSWITSNAELCASIGRRWKHEMGHVGMAECRSKAEYAATGGLAAQTALQETLEQSGTIGTVVERPKVLGTRLQLTRAHTGPSEDETKRLNTAQYLILEAAALPVTRHQALFFAKSTGMAVATSCGWSQLPNLQELQKLQRAIDACHGDAHSLGAAGPLHRLLAGHTASPRFQVGAHQTLHLLMHLDGGLRDCWQSMRQNQGPIMMLRRWMERQGWKALEPWVWEHTDAHSILDARLPAHRGNAAWLARGGRVVCSLPGQGKAHVAHMLRDAWRAQQWREFSRLRYQSSSGCGPFAMAGRGTEGGSRLQGV
ncbi:Pol [Symbiodinium sp. CCMP2592]|nr:Pol [Symbiodinium sp. CCMP2592]